MTPLLFIGSSLRDLREMPEEIQDEVGHALLIAQQGGKHDSAKPLQGFGSAGVLEIVESFDGNAYRAVYTVRFEGRVYVLHVFQKKSTQGITTSKSDVDLIKRRFREAEETHRRWQK